MYRAAVEELCTQQGAAGANLKARLNDLTSKGVEAAVVHDLHEARLLGNWSLDNGLVFTAEEVT